MISATECTVAAWISISGSSQRYTEVTLRTRGSVALPRLRPHRSEPEDDGSGESDREEEDCGALTVAGGDGAPALGVAEHDLMRVRRLWRRLSLMMGLQTDFCLGM